MEKEALYKMGLGSDQVKKVLEINKQELDKARIDSAVDLALVKAGAKNIVATKALIDFAQIKIENDVISGIDEQIDVLVKGVDTAFLFGETEKAKLKGNVPEESKDGSKPDFGSMTYTEMCRYMQK